MLTSLFLGRRRTEGGANRGKGRHRYRYEIRGELLVSSSAYVDIDGGRAAIVTYKIPTENAVGISLVNTMVLSADYETG